MTFGNPLVAKSRSLSLVKIIKFRLTTYNIKPLKLFKVITLVIRYGFSKIFAGTESSFIKEMSEYHSCKNLFNMN